MVIFYTKYKRYDEIQLTKNKMDKMDFHRWGRSPSATGTS